MRFRGLYLPLIILFFLITMLFVSYAKAEEKSISLRFPNNVPGRTIFTYILAKDIYHEFSDIGSGELNLIVKRQLSQEEVDNMIRELPQYGRQLRSIFNATNALLREMQWRNAQIIEQLQLDEGGNIKGGTIGFREGYVGDIIAKVEMGDIQVYNAIINFSENKIYLGRQGYFKIFDTKTRAIYYYKFYEFRNNITISYKYDNFLEIFFNLSRSKIKISCDSIAEEIDEFCAYHEVILSQDSEFPLKIKHFTKVSGIFYYVRRDREFFTNKWNETKPELKTAGRKLPLIKQFSYDTFFDLRTEKFVFFLLTKSGEEQKVCYERFKDVFYYYISPNCNLKVLGNLEYGLSTEIYRHNVTILQPNSKEELQKIINIIKG